MPSALRTTYKTRWEDVYNVHDDAPVQTLGGSSQYAEWAFYQTYGGSPEGGYITDGSTVIAVHRLWFTTWTMKQMKGKLQFERGNSMKGTVARVRFIRRR